MTIKAMSTGQHHDAGTTEQAEQNPARAGVVSDVVPGSMIGRIALILTAFGGDDHLLGISELARRTGLSKATVSRIVKELVAYEFLERRGHQVRLGLKFFELGWKTRGPQELRRLAIATLADLRRATGHTIHLAVLEGREVVYIEILPGRDGIQLPSRVGGRLPAHATGVGKAILAHALDAWVEAYLREPLEKVGPRTITSIEELRVELRAIHSQGVAYEREESGPGVCCAASPILRSTGIPLAAISVSGALKAMDPERVAPAVQAATLGLNRLIRMNPQLNHL